MDSWIYKYSTRPAYKSEYLYLLPNRLYTELLPIFCYVMSHWTIDQAIFSAIDWHFTMAWFAASLLK